MLADRALVGRAVTLLRDTIAFLGRTVTLVGHAIAPWRRAAALVGRALPLVGHAVAARCRAVAFLGRAVAFRGLLPILCGPLTITLALTSVPGCLLVLAHRALV